MAIKNLREEEKQNIRDAVDLLRRVAEANLKHPARGYVGVLLTTLQSFFI